jgi:hypothetical protein
MPLPITSSIEMPILQELTATGGTDNLRFLYERLTDYFPQLTSAEILEIKSGAHKNWRKAVQKAGRILEENDFVKRERGVWSISEKGKRAVEAEISGFILTTDKSKTLTHVNIQEMLVEIGVNLGFYAETEFEFYDVIWRERERSPRLSHIFEVQSKGNLDSALAKLKRAYHAQRTKPYLVLSTEKDLNRVRKSLDQEFQDMESEITVLTFAQIRGVHQNLKNIGEIVKDFLLK